MDRNRQTIDFNNKMHEQILEHGKERGRRSFGEAVRDIIRLWFDAQEQKNIDFIDTKRAAALLGYTQRYIIRLCNEKALKGASKFGGMWLIPMTTIELLQIKKKLKMKIKMLKKVVCNYGTFTKGKEIDLPPNMLQRLPKDSYEPVEAKESEVENANNTINRGSEASERIPGLSLGGAGRRTKRPKR